MSGFFLHSLTVDQLQYKLSNLRGYYSRELSKIRKSQRMGTDDVYISSWRLFEPLDSFLRQHIIPRKAPTCDVVDLVNSPFLKSSPVTSKLKQTEKSCFVYHSFFNV